MLVQKGGLSKTTKNLLIILGSIIVLGGGYFAYDYFLAGSGTTEGNLLTDENLLVSKKIKTSLDTSIFDDPQFQKLSRDEYEGFVEQVDGIALSQETPIKISEISVMNPKTGNSLIVFWKLPEYINFTQVVIYRSTVVGQKGEEIARAAVSADDAMSVGSYQDWNLDNDTRYYYYVDTVMTDEEETPEQQTSSGRLITLIANSQVNAVPTDETAPEPPVNVRVMDDGQGNLQVAWSNPDDQDLDRINVYRSSEKGKVGSLLDSISADDLVDYVWNEDYYIYTDESVNENTVYYYTVTSEDSSGNESTTDVLAAPNKNVFYNPFQPIQF